MHCLFGNQHKIINYLCFCFVVVECLNFLLDFYWVLTSVLLLAYGCRLFCFIYRYALILAIVSCCQMFFPMLKFCAVLISKNNWLFSFCVIDSMFCWYIRLMYIVSWVKVVLMLGRIHLWGRCLYCLGKRSWLLWRCGAFRLLQRLAWTWSSLFYAIFHLFICHVKDLYFVDILEEVFSFLPYLFRNCQQWL